MDRKLLTTYIKLGMGFMLISASASIYRALWPFIVEEAGVGSFSYGGFLSLANILSVFIKYGIVFINSAGALVLIGAFLHASSSAVLLLGYTHITILLAVIFQYLGMSIAFMSRNVLTGLETPQSSRGIFAASLTSAGQIGMIVGINLGLLLYFVTGTYTSALIAGVILGFSSALLLASWLKTPISHEKVTLKILIPKHYSSKILIAISCADSFVWSMIFGFIYVLAPEYLGADEGIVGLAQTLTMAIGIPLNMVMGYFSDKIGSRKFFLMISEIAGALAFLIYAVLRSPLALVVFGGLMGVVIASWGPIIIAYFTEITPRSELGKTLSSWSILTSISRIPHPLLEVFS